MPMRKVESWGQSVRNISENELQARRQSIKQVKLLSIKKTIAMRHDTIFGAQEKLKKRRNLLKGKENILKYDILLFNFVLLIKPLFYTREILSFFFIFLTTFSNSFFLFHHIFLESGIFFLLAIHRLIPSPFDRVALNRFNIYFCAWA